MTFLDALASLKPILFSHSLTNRFEIANITSESISENELGLCQYYFRVSCHAMSNVKFQMSNANCQMSNVNCYLSDIKCQVSDVRCQMPEDIAMSEPSPALFWKCSNCDFVHLMGEEGLLRRASSGGRCQREAGVHQAAVQTHLFLELPGRVRLRGEQYKKVRLIFIWVSFDSLKVFKNVP